MPRPLQNQKASPLEVLSLGRVVLLGIAQRQVRVSRSHIPAKRNSRKPLPTSVKTLGDLIHIKRYEKRLTRQQLAEKMGIAHTLIRAWERGASQPSEQQMEQLRKLLADALRLDLPPSKS